ncbi:MAG: hypothetical protein AAF492_15725 [Verrucomicrobiota bacterium]
MKKIVIAVCILSAGMAQAQMTDKEIDLWNFALDNLGKDPLETVKFKDDPLEDIADDMKVSSQELGRLKTDEPVQDLQENILAKIDKLIEGMEKECSSCSGGSGQAGALPSRPAAKSVIMGGPGGSGDLHAPKEGRKKWAELPDQERDKIMQSLSEGFPPGYEVILERYFKNLAEEKPVGESEPGESPTVE